MSEMETTLGELAYNTYCEQTNWKSKFSGQDLPSFSNNLKEVREWWQLSAESIKKEVLKDRYCFIQDNDCHWYIIPFENKEEFELACENDDEEMLLSYSDYRTGGAIQLFNFTDPRDN